VGLSGFCTVAVLNRTSTLRAGAPKNLSSSRRHNILIAVVHRDFVEPGTAVAIVNDGQVLPTAVAGVPFADL
jgi:hypothetical protein